MTRAGIAAFLLGIAGLPAVAGAATILFVGNSFTAGAGSPVERYRPDTVTDLNREGIGGVPALFRSFARQAGLDYDVYLETAGGRNLDFHHDEKLPLIARAWDHVVLQGHSTLDAEAPGDPGKIIDYAARLGRLLHDENPDVDVRLFATWPRADQTYLQSGHWHGRPIEAMAADLRSAYDEAAARSPHVRSVIPVGQAWIRAITDGVAARNPYAGIGPGQVNLWADDSYHASAHGSYLAALVIFGSVTGRDPRSLGRGEEAAAALGMAPDLALVLQRIAFESVGNWRRVAAASDEFEGSALDAGRWKTGLWYETSGVLAFKPANVSVHGGNLALTARREAFGDRDYTIGAVESLFDVPGATSYVEVRARALPRDANVLSAVWLQSSPLTVASNPNPEIDLQETFDYRVLASTLHAWVIRPDRPLPSAPDDYLHTQTPRHDFPVGVDVGEDFHVYGLERSDGMLRFYFDGTLAWEIAPPDPSFVDMPRHVVLSLEGHLGDPADGFLPQSFLVDYVRTYVPAAD